MENNDGWIELIKQTAEDVRAIREKVDAQTTDLTVFKTKMSIASRMTAGVGVCVSTVASSLIAWAIVRAVTPH